MIGIGAGVDCDGQIIILHDILGFSQNHSILLDDKHSDSVAAPAIHFRNFLALSTAGIPGAVAAYVRAVKAREFPSDKEKY